MTFDIVKSWLPEHSAEVAAWLPMFSCDTTSCTRLSWQPTHTAVRSTAGAEADQFFGPADTPEFRNSKFESGFLGFITPAIYIALNSPRNICITIY
jgi:hypothetical protein